MMMRPSFLLRRFLWSSSICLCLIASSIEADEFEKFWTDSAQILEDLSDYQALWVKIHNCVWSECAVDSYDDDGENRDGDENWYEGRTQQFCANAAFSLYGIPKNHVSATRCSRGNYINSFFTYGGADTLLTAIGKQPPVYYSDNGYQNNYDGNGNAYQNTNANCMVLSDDDDNNSQDNHRVLRFRRDVVEEASQRALSGDNNNDYSSGTSSAMGCTADGKFNMAKFDGQTCDGNYFLGAIDGLGSYNRQVRQVGCHKIWGRSFGSTDIATSLLSNSWSCDIDLYPKGCPDPYGIKQRYANAIHAVSHGESPRMAMWNGRLKLPLRILSWLMFVGGLFLTIFGYRLRNKERIRTKGGGLTGWVRCITEDLRQANARRKMSMRNTRRSRADEQGGERKKKRKKKKRRSKSKSRKSSTKSSRGRDHDDDDDMEQQASPSRSSSRKSRSKKNYDVELVSSQSHSDVSRGSRSGFMA